jgi:hypothetical protein
LLRTASAWRVLPSDFPEGSTVRRYFYAWPGPKVAPRRHGRVIERREAVQQEPHFVVVRVHRRSELPSTYLPRFALAGRDGLRQLAFGPAGTAHPFEHRAEAEDLARRLRRRVSTADYHLVVEKSAMAAASPAED